MGAFGFFELINDFEVAKALFDAAYSWLKEHGCGKNAWSPQSFPKR